MAYVYVSRGFGGVVNGVFSVMQPGIAERAILDTDPEVLAFKAAPTAPQTVLSQDLIAQFTVGDYTAIKTAIAGNDSFGLLWASLQTQKDPMAVTHTRFLDGWHALVSVLGQPRMDVIAGALGITVK